MYVDLKWYQNIKKNQLICQLERQLDRAGYDLKQQKDTVVPSIWKALLAHNGLNNLLEGNAIKEENKEFLASTLVPTGIKAFMPEREYITPS